MINFSDGLKHLYLPKLNEVSQNITFGLNNWLSQGSDYFVSSNHPTNDFTIGTYDYFDFLKPYSYDINRLSCASMESIRDIERKNWQAKFIGWNITKFYYSAFFSAHCILKITGNSLSNIEQSSINKIRSITTSYGYTYGNINTGLFCISVDSLNNSFRFHKDPQYDNSHEGLWKYFLHFLINSQNSIYGQLPQAEAQQLVDKINELATALRNWNSQSGNWLSRVRNLVNYSQSYGVWFPYKEYIAEYDRLYSFLNLHKTNPLTIDLHSFIGKDILYFARTCQLINAIANDLLTDLESKHPANKSFIKTGVKQFENLYA
jgi:hypothetical protein